MTRALDGALLAAMNSGIFTPYFKVQLMDSNRTSVMYSTTDVLEFEINSLSAKISFHDPTYHMDFKTFRIQRGCWIAGAANVITTSCFWPRVDRHYKRIRTLEGHLFPDKSYTTAGDVTYHQIIDTICDYYHFHTVTFEDPAAAWLSYQFLPTGSTMNLKDASSFFTLLRQKYLIFGTDLGADALYFFQAKNTTPAEAAYTHTVAKEIHSNASLNEKSFVSKDESNVVHTSGTATNPVHNLGWLHSTASHPARTWSLTTPEWVVKGIVPNLKYLDFDPMAFIYDLVDLNVWPIVLKEVYNKSLAPSWQWWGKFLDIFGNTEGGSISESAYVAAPFTPLNVSLFNGILSDHDTNLQSAMDTIDDHNHFYWLPFQTYTSHSPISVDDSLPYSAAIDRAITYVKFTMVLFVATTNDGSNYWEIRLKVITTNALIEMIDTSAIAVNTTVQVSSTSFDIAGHNASNLGLLIGCIKVGSPGNLYIYSPVLFVTID